MVVVGLKRPWGLTLYPKYIQPVQFKLGGIGALKATWGLSVVVGDSQESGIVVG